MPKLVHFACTGKPTTKQREKVVPRAVGKVLEIGVGSGLNLPHYDASRIEHVWGLDPSPEMHRMAAERAGECDFEVQFIEAPAEAIPLDNGAADTVLVTYSLCSIPETIPALSEMRRVLKPGGRLVFCEHGHAPDEGVQRWQRRINPVWRKMGGGCNLDRKVPSLLEQGGFRIRELETAYIPGWKFASYNYWGTAVHA